MSLSSVVTATQVLVWATSFGAAAEVRGALDGYTGAFAAANAYNALNILLVVAQAGWVQIIRDLTRAQRTSVG